MLKKRVHYGCVFSKGQHPPPSFSLPTGIHALHRHTDNRQPIPGGKLGASSQARTTSNNAMV